MSQTFKDYEKQLRFLFESVVSMRPDSVLCPNVDLCPDSALRFGEVQDYGLRCSEDLKPYVARDEAMRSTNIRSKLPTDFHLSNPWMRCIKGDAFSPHKRLQVYQEGYALRLEAAIIADYPALTAYWGETLMAQQVQKFVKHHPSQHWDLNLYSPAFAQDLQLRLPQSPQAALATLEAAIVLCFWVPPMPSLQAPDLMSLSEEAFANLRLQLRPTVRLLSLSHTALSYLNAFRNREKHRGHDNPIDVSDLPLDPTVEKVLLVNLGEGVKRLHLDDDQFHILHALHEGKSVGEAMNSMNQVFNANEKTQRWWQDWLEWKIFMPIGEHLDKDE